MIPVTGIGKTVTNFASNSIKKSDNNALEDLGCYSGCLLNPTASSYTVVHFCRKDALCVDLITRTLCVENGKALSDRSTSTTDCRSSRLDQRPTDIVTNTNTATLRYVHCITTALCGRIVCAFFCLWASRSYQAA